MEVSLTCSTFIMYLNCIHFSVGTVLTLPMTVLLDWILKDHVMAWQAFIGVGVIVMGFFLLIFSEYWTMRRNMISSSKSEGMSCSLSKKVDQNNCKRKVKNFIKIYFI